MKIRRICIFITAVLILAVGMVSCNQHGGKLASIAVTPEIQSMVKDSTLQFVATATLSSGTTLYWSQVVTWSSSDEDVATIDNTLGLNGLVKSKVSGTTIITAYDAANNISGTAMLTVTDPISLRITPREPGMAIGTALQLGAIGTFPDNTTQNIASLVSWSSSSLSDVGLATVGTTSYDNGLITAGSATGTATIQAVYSPLGSSSTLFDSTTLTVTQTHLASLVIGPSNYTIVNGSTQQLVAIGTYLDGTTRYLSSSVTWTSPNTDIVVFKESDPQGLATAVGAGVATITATDPVTSVAGKTTLTVTAN